MDDSFQQLIFGCTQSNVSSHQNLRPRGYEQHSDQDYWVVPQIQMSRYPDEQAHDQYAELYSDRNNNHQVGGSAAIERQVKLREQVGNQQKKKKENCACPMSCVPCLPVNIPDEELRNAPIKELWAKLKGSDTEIIRAVKTKRRTLKNVVYARVSRNKKAKMLQDAVDQCEKLTKQLNEAEETINHLKRQLEFFHQKSHETTNLYVRPSPSIIEEMTMTMTNFGDQLSSPSSLFTLPPQYESLSQIPSVLCNHEYGETDSLVSSSTSNDYGTWN